MDVQFRDRQEAGQMLANRLTQWAKHENVVVLALPRGGLPVAYPIAQAIHAPLDVFLVRKLGTPGQEELAMGAIAEGGFRVLNPGVVGMLGVSEEVIDAATAREQRELERRAQLYRKGREPSAIKGQVAILVDDGLATGASMMVASDAVQAQKPQRTIVAVPVAPGDICKVLRDKVDEVVCLQTPVFFGSVGSWYEDFHQVTDDEVCDILERAHEQISVS